MTANIHTSNLDGLGRNYITLIGTAASYTETEVMDKVEKKFGQRPISAKLVNSYPSTNYEYVSVYEVVIA